MRVCRAGYTLSFVAACFFAQALACGDGKSKSTSAGDSGASGTSNGSNTAAGGNSSGQAMSASTGGGDGSGGAGGNGATSASGEGGSQSASTSGAGAPGSGGSGGAASGHGAASCDGLITDQAPHPMSALFKPARFEAATDPEFGTRIVRVTDVESESGGEVIKPMYSTVQAWNADETLMILYDVGSGHRLYDGQSYEFIRGLDINPADLEQVYWHPRDPDVLFFADGNELVRYTVSDDSGEVVHSFDGCGSVSGGDDPMYISWDGNSFGFLCDATQAFVYHLDGDAESERIDGPGLGPQVAPSGNLVYLAGDIYDGNMAFLRTLELDNPYDHASLGQLATGEDTLNIVAFDPGSPGGAVGTLVVFDLTTGEDRVVIGEDTGYPYPPSGTHISAVAHRAPGWVAVSVVGNDLDGREVLDNELLLADTNTSEVCRIAHHRSHGKDGPQDYWAEPHASVSPSATRVLFASDWGGGETVDTYVVELPSYVP